MYSHTKYGDEKYEPRSDCDWTIEAQPGYNVHLTFLTFNLEDEKDCGYDYVEVFNGPDLSSGPSYGRFCGNTVSFVNIVLATLIKYTNYFFNIKFKPSLPNRLFVSVTIV